MSVDWSQGQKIEISSEEDYRLFVKRAFPKFALDMIEGPYVIWLERYKELVKEYKQEEKKYKEAVNNYD